MFNPFLAVKIPEFLNLKKLFYNIKKVESNWANAFISLEKKQEIVPHFPNLKIATCYYNLEIEKDRDGMEHLRQQHNITFKKTESYVLTFTKKQIAYEFIEKYELKSCLDCFPNGKIGIRLSSQDLENIDNQLRKNISLEFKSRL